MEVIEGRDERKRGKGKGIMYDQVDFVFPALKGRDEKRRVHSVSRFIVIFFYIIIDRMYLLVYKGIERAYCRLFHS